MKKYICLESFAGLNFSYSAGEEFKGTDKKEIEGLIKAGLIKEVKTNAKAN